MNPYLSGMPIERIISTSLQFGAERLENIITALAHERLENLITPIVSNVLGSAHSQSTRFISLINRSYSNFVTIATSIANRTVNLTSRDASAHLDTVRFLLSDGRLYNLEGAVCISAQNGHLDTVQFLLSEGRTISQNHLGLAVRGVAENGHLNVVQFLLSNGRTISQNDLGWAVYNAAYNGHLDTVQFLLSEGRTISQNHLGWAVADAAQNGHLDTVQFLLSSGRQLSLRARSELILDFSSRISIDILELILQNGPIGESARNSAITQASGPNRDRIIDMLNRAAVTNDHISLDDAVSYGRIRISLAALNQNPDDFLKVFSSRESFPRGFVLEDSPSTLDLGGVTKQVISTLFTRLEEKHQGIYWSPDKFLINESDTDLVFYTDLAKVLSLVFEANKSRTDKFLIGSVFNKKFFSILKAYMQSPDPALKFQKIADLMKECENPYYKSLCDYVLNPTDDNKATLLINAEALEKETGNFDDFLAKEKLNILQPLEKFIEGLSEELKAKINSSDSDRLLSDIQGAEITSESLKNALTFENIPERVKNLILNKINEADEDWLKLFVVSITGNRNLSPDTKIKIQPSHRDVFEIHTCFDSLDLPLRSIQDMSDGDFLASLDAAIQNSEFYNIA